MSRTAHFAALAILPGLAAGFLCAAEAVVERSFVSAADFESFYRDAAIDLYSAPGAITLRREIYSPSPRDIKQSGGTNAVPFSPAKMGRKTFILPDDKNGTADIFACPGGGEALLNGKPVAFGPFPHRGGWTRAEVPADFLKAGINELIFTNAFSLVQDPDSKPVSSFFSVDGGKTWKQAEGGEFRIRIRVRRYPEKGVITSTVLDAADAGKTNAIVPLLKIRSLEIQWRSIVPGDGSVKVEARSGPLPWPDQAWTPWVPAERVLPARFVQVRAIITASSGALSPSLARLTLTARGEIAADPDAQGLILRDFRNPLLIRRSYPYFYQRPATNLVQLREIHKLNEVIAGAATDLDKAILLRNWVRFTRVERGGATPTGFFIQCALALGFNARPVLLATRPGAEFWCRELGKWVLMDVEAVLPDDSQARAAALYRQAATREPLNVLDLHQAVNKALRAGESNVMDVLQIVTRQADDGTLSTSEGVRGPDKGLEMVRSFCVPDRNDHLDRPGSWDEDCGFSPASSNSCLWWRTQTPFERDAHQPLSTDRVGDINWCLHVPRLFLTASEQKGTLTVLADTVTPNLQAFRFAASGKEPVLLPGDGADPDSRRALFTWKLEPGVNTLSVTTLNAFDREGKAATVSVEWKQPQPEEKP
jgi:hypothetical protein